MFQLKLKNSFFKQNGLFLHHNGLQNSILIKLKYCLSILEILDFALLRYPKKAGTHTLQDFNFNCKKFGRRFWCQKTHVDVVVIRKMSF